MLLYQALFKKLANEAVLYDHLEKLILNDLASNGIADISVFEGTEGPNVDKTKWHNFGSRGDRSQDYTVMFPCNYEIDSKKASGTGKIVVRYVMTNSAIKAREEDFKKYISNATNKSSLNEKQKQAIVNLRQYGEKKQGIPLDAIAGAIYLVDNVWNEEQYSQLLYLDDGKNRLDITRELDSILNNPKYYYSEQVEDNSSGAKGATAKYYFEFADAASKKVHNSGKSMGKSRVTDWEDPDITPPLPDKMQNVMSDLRAYDPDEDINEVDFLDVNLEDLALYLNKENNGIDTLDEAYYIAKEIISIRDEAKVGAGDEVQDHIVNVLQLVHDLKSGDDSKISGTVDENLSHLEVAGLLKLVKLYLTSWQNDLDEVIKTVGYKGNLDEHTITNKLINHNYSEFASNLAEVLGLNSIDLASLYSRAEEIIATADKDLFNFSEEDKPQNLGLNTEHAFKTKEELDKLKQDEANEQETSLSEDEDESKDENKEAPEITIGDASTTASPPTGSQLEDYDSAKDLPSTVYSANEVFKFLLEDPSKIEDAVLAYLTSTYERDDKEVDTATIQAEAAKIQQGILSNIKSYNIADNRFKDNIKKDKDEAIQIIGEYLLETVDNYSDDLYISINIDGKTFTIPNVIYLSNVYTSAANGLAKWIEDNKGVSKLKSYLNRDKVPTDSLLSPIESVTPSEEDPDPKDPKDSKEPKDSKDKD